MKLYGTQKTKEEIEEKIRELENESCFKLKSISDGIKARVLNSNIYVYKQLLADFVVLPEIEDATDDWGKPDSFTEALIVYYPQGVIIKTK